MLKLLIIVGTLIAGYVAYLQFEPHIPQRLAFLKLGSATSSSNTVDADKVQAAQTRLLDGWSIQEVGGALFFHRQLAGSIVARLSGKTYSYAPPEFYLICETEGTWLGIDASAPLANADIEIQGHHPEWRRSGSLWVAKDQEALDAIRNGEELRFSLTYSDAGSVSLLLPARDSKKLKSLANQAHCRF